MLSVACVFSLVSICFAADNDNDFDRFGVRIRGIYVLPDQSIDGRLSSFNIRVQDAVAPEVDLEYFITRHFSAELVAALTKHDILVNGGGASLWLLPPSLLFKYHPIPKAMISPYIGFGLNVVMPFDEELSLGGTPVPFRVDSSVGWAAQVGVDIPITKKCFFNIDAKYYSTGMDMYINGTRYDLNLNPFIIGTGIGVRF